MSADDSFFDFSILDGSVPGEKRGLAFFVRACVLAARASDTFLSKFFSVSHLQALILYMPKMLPTILLFTPLVYLIIYSLRNIVPQFQKVREENLFLRFITRSKPFPSRLAAEQAFNELLQRRAEAQYMLEKEREWQVGQKNDKALPEGLPVSECVRMLRELPGDNSVIREIADDMERLPELPHLVMRCMPLVLEIGRHKELSPDEEGFLRQMQHAVQSAVASRALVEQMEFTARLKAAGTMLDIKGFHS